MMKSIVKSKNTSPTAVPLKLSYRKYLQKVSPKSIMVRYKQVTCRICSRSMRSDNLERHMHVHNKNSPNEKPPQSAEAMCRDLVLDVVDKVVALEEESSGMKRKHEEVECEAKTTIDMEALRKSALKLNKEYEDKLELGKALYKLLDKGLIQEESFLPDWKNALESYLKHPETAVLKPWQAELLKHIDNPSDTKIVWVQGKKMGRR